MRCRTEQAYVTTLASGLPITRSPAELKGLSYPERLKLTTLETRRLRCDLIEVSKTLKGLDKIDKNTVFFFLESNSFCRGHSEKSSSYND